MAVIFTCACGRRLKARHRQRGYISFCPGCGAAVKVPTGKATHRGVAALSEAERLATPFPASTAAPLPASGLTEPNGAPAAGAVDPPVISTLDDRPVPPAAGIAPSHPAISLRGRRVPAPIVRDDRENWFESARYTLPVVPMLLLLSLFVTVSSAAVLRGLADSHAATPVGGLRHVLIPSAAILLGLLAWIGALLGSILALSLEGSPKVAGFPNLDAVLRSSAQWAVCFLAGPALLLGAAGVYWLSFGDPGVVDDIVLAELATLSTGWFLAALVNTTGSGRFWQFHPPALLPMVSSQIGRIAVTSLVGSVLLFGFAKLGAFAITQVHLSAFEGSLWLGLFWFSGLASTAFAFRRLGLRHHRPAGPLPKPAPVSRPAKQRGSRIALSQTPG